MEKLCCKEKDTNAMTAEAGGLAVGPRLRHEVRVVGRRCTLCWLGDALLSGRLILPSVPSHRLEWPW